MEIGHSLIVTSPAFSLSAGLFIIHSQLRGFEIQGYGITPPTRDSDRMP